MANNGSSNSTGNILKNVGAELKANPPAQLAKTSAKFGPARAQKQKVAILLSKARKAGASVPKAPRPSMSKGGSI